MFSCSDGDLMWFRIGFDVPFSLLITEDVMELITFKYSLLVESFSGTRPQAIINKIVKITKPIEPKIRKIFIMIKKVILCFLKLEISN